MSLFDALEAARRTPDDPQVVEAWLTAVHHALRGMAAGRIDPDEVRQEALVRVHRCWLACEATCEAQARGWLRTI
ncbi:MAG: hypothetical protein ABMB14_31855, partial [Myxococcota bacterium]